jgi:hypothetical protein
MLRKEGRKERCEQKEKREGCQERNKHADVKEVKREGGTSRKEGRKVGT